MHRSLWACLLVACGAAQTSVDAPQQASSWKELRLVWQEQRIVLTPDGTFVWNDASERKVSKLDGDELKKLRAIATPDFVAKLGTFTCAQLSDATATLEIDDKKQEVAGCARGQGDASVHALIYLLNEHRSPSPPERSGLPDHQGDSCTAEKGCARGYVCAIAPCVVAPCTMGTCQKTE
jgi:hypothetical protein